MAGILQTIARRVVFLLRKGDQEDAASVPIRIYLILILLPVVVMATLAVFILYKTGRNRNGGSASASTPTSASPTPSTFAFSFASASVSTTASTASTVRDEFMKLVATVAVVYCLCQIPMFIDFFYLSFHGHRLPVFRFLTNLFIMVNSTFNFFIYFAFSKNFNHAFRRFFSELGSCA